MRKMSLALSSIYRFRARKYKSGPILWTRVVPNIVVVEGRNDILTKYFKGSAYTASPSLGLINNADFGSLQSTDTAAKITTAAPTGMTNQWKELEDYDEADRVDLVLGTASNGVLDNSASPAEFTINATVSVKGAFVISDNTKGGTAGVLYGAAVYSVVQSLESGNVLEVTIELRATSLS